MSKTSITEKFAQDAINAPALVTGGKGCKAKSNKAKSKKAKSNKAKSNSGRGGSKGGNACYVPPPCKW